MAELTTYIQDNALIIIPFIYVLGMIIKNTKAIDDKYIPVILLPISIVTTMFLTKEFDVVSVIQGTLITGAATYSNQIYKQLFKNNKDTKEE